MNEAYMNEEVYLTFKTPRHVSEFLKFVAHKKGKSQPKLIDEICQKYIREMLEMAEEEMAKQAENADE